jgi:hypothetical protein
MENVFNELLLERSYDLRLYVNTNAFTLDMKLAAEKKYDDTNIHHR